MATDTAWFNPRGGGYFHMDDRGRFIQKQYNPNNVHIGEGYGGGPLGKGNPRNDTMQLANYSTDKRIYNDWMIKDLLNQGSIGPGEVIDIGKPGYKQVVPKLMGQQLAMNKGLDNWGGNLKGTFDQPGYGDPSSLDPWGNDWGRGYIPDYNYDPYDDDVLDPGFGDHSIGPLYFG